MTNYKVSVVGPHFRSQVTHIFAIRHPLFTVVPDHKDADIMVFTGGEDINPGLYGQPTLPQTYFTQERDDYELNALADNPGKIYVGICRGAQLLNVSLGNGGSMWQHITGHGGGIHPAIDTDTGLEVSINSIHHQGMIPGKDGRVLAYATLAGTKISPATTLFRADNPNERDVEAIWYPKTKCFCFQAHPEFGHRPTTNYFFDLLKSFVLDDINHEGATCAA